MKEELQVAVDAARRAGRLQMERYEKLERIVHKSEHDVVTEVDHLSEDLIIGAIREAFPTDSFLAEESGHHAGQLRAVRRRRQGGWPGVGDRSARRHHQLRQRHPILLRAIGLSIDGQAVLGVVYDPVRDELFSAVAGGGSDARRRADRGCRSRSGWSTASRRCHCRGAGWAKRDHGVRRSIRVSRSMGSAALALTYLANGRFDLFIQSGGMCAWDICAAGLIAAEGGARLTTLDGGPWFDINKPTKSIGLLGAAPVHHQTLLELLR